MTHGDSVITADTIVIYYILDGIQSILVSITQGDNVVILAVDPCIDARRIAIAIPGIIVGREGVTVADTIGFELVLIVHHARIEAEETRCEAVGQRYPIGGVVADGAIAENVGNIRLGWTNGYIESAIYFTGTDYRQSSYK